jgi:hypothetical protein
LQYAPCAATRGEASHLLKADPGAEVRGWLFYFRCLGSSAVWGGQTAALLLLVAQTANVDQKAR